MKNIKYFIFSLLLISQIAASQWNERKQLQLSHPLNISQFERKYKYKPYATSADTITVVAIMVQFQEDNDPLSTGNGKFDLSNKYYNPNTQRDTVIDSPPHDSAYFADHLLFLKNYYRKSSKGKLVINYEIHGNTITLSKKMQMYSPQKNETFIKLGEFFKESWAAADSVINFSGYDQQNTAFVIFHAGTGRDVDLSSIYGYDPTPYDIPSVYLGLKNLKEFYGNSYNGYQTAEGIFIQNSLIIPSTELRELDLISGKYLIELGINGILVGSFGSYLGLPDLFNTFNGKTAIGRFGLMDGQSIFSFNGIFPPEPSAWEKYYLGWINPVVLSSGNAEFNINASSVPYAQESTMYKVLINTSEYFLLENRNRNPFNLGQRIYTRNRAHRDSTLYTKDQEGFISYDITKIDGNVTDVSYLDWSLPGSIDDTSNFRGGILIWHIDENVINAKFQSNTINNEIEHKGVDLEEAKGSQNIGVTYNTIFGEVTGDGFFVDFWYNGNHYVPANIYKNEFSPYSIPNSYSYSLSNNNIYITHFDTIGTSMTFRVKIGSDIIKPIEGFPKYTGMPSAGTSNPIAFDVNGDNIEELFVNTSNGIYGFKNNGMPISSDSTGNILPLYGITTPALCYSPALNSLRLIAVSKTAPNSSSLGLFKFDNNFNITDSLIETITGNYFTSSPLVFDSNKIVIGTDGMIYYKNLVTLQTGFTDTNSGQVYQLSKTSPTSFVYSVDSQYISTGNITGINAVDNIKTSPNSVILNNKQILSRYGIEGIKIPFTLADINKDEKQEILIADKGKLYAFNGNEVLMDYFPSTKIKGNISSGIVSADIDNDGLIDILTITSEGDMYAVNTEGRILNGFPIKTGISGGSTPALFNSSDTLCIAVYGSDGYLYAYRTGYHYFENNILWKNVNGDKYFSNNNFKSLFSPVVYSDKLPSDRVYNWPNPVYDTKTYIRYYLNGNAGTVKIKILDLSGELITKLAGSNYSNSDNEVIWDVSNVQSGIYYGVIEAEIDGTTETKIIKIAVVK
ncbi:MAG: T9SS type A sorting domain-containing protein [Ignavibacteria bacterium]|nr:T9SS type A sorting domain-containing protein [Ignavibacteria bacterium]